MFHVYRNFFICSIFIYWNIIKSLSWFNKLNYVHLGINVLMVYTLYIFFCHVDIYLSYLNELGVLECVYLSKYFSKFRILIMSLCCTCLCVEHDGLYIYLGICCMDLITLYVFIFSFTTVYCSLNIGSFI